MRKTILIISCIAIGFLVGCGASTKAEHDKEFIEWVDSTGISVIKDVTTGVEYIEVYTSNGLAITPRYNADGTLYTGE